MLVALYGGQETAANRRRGEETDSEASPNGRGLKNWERALPSPQTVYSPGLSMITSFMV